MPPLIQSRRVDAMRQQIARHTASGRVRHRAARERFATLRQILGDGPVLQRSSRGNERCGPSFPAVDDLLRERDGRDAAVIVPNHVMDIRLFHGAGTSASPSSVFIASGFLAEDHLAGFGGGEGDFLVQSCSARKCRPRRCRLFRAASASRFRSIRIPTSSANAPHRFGALRAQAAFSTG